MDASASTFQHRVFPGNETLDNSTDQTVLAEAARRFSTAIKPRDDLPTQVQHLAFGVDPQAGP